MKNSLFWIGIKKLTKDKVALVSLFIVFIFFTFALLSSLGLIATNWSELTDESFAPISKNHWFGTNINGQDIFSRAIYSTKIAFEVGMSVSFISVLIGAVLGLISGYFRGILDHMIMWTYGTLDSIPFYLFVGAIAFVLEGNPYAMHIAMIFTFWAPTTRLIRGEVLKIKNSEYIDAAKSIGVHPLGILFKHILPNTSHILLVQFTINFIAAIKSEVILSFLGLGVKDSISWGIMISESIGEISSGKFNNFLSASTLLFILTFGFSTFSDALQDALDPKKL